MENQIFIRVKKGDNFFDKDIRDTTAKDRSDYYNTLSKGQIAGLLELFVVDCVTEKEVRQ